MPRGIVKRSIAVMLSLCLALPTIAEQDETPSALAMVGDLAVARPVGAAITVVGIATFVATLPFSVLGGNVTKAGEVLVVGPARETFVRCLGCKRAN